MNRKTLAAAVILTALLMSTALWFYGDRVAFPEVEKAKRLRKRKPRTRLRSTNDVTSERRLPDAIIIGAKKAGTRALLAWIKLHPNVTCLSKEAHFFDRDEVFQRGINFYQAMMPFADETQTLLEKTPSYLITPLVPSRIATTMPKKTKFLVILRDPVTRAVSDFMQALDREGERQRTPQPAKSFDDRVLKRCERGWCVNSDSSLVSIGEYARHVRRWLHTFSRDRFLFLDAGKFTSDPVASMREVERFLDLPSYFDEKKFYFNKEKGFYCRNPDQPGYTGHGDGCLGSKKGREHAKMNDETLKKLKDYYAPLNKKLQELLPDVEFNWKYED